jgi:hypothetical protein
MHMCSFSFHEYGNDQKQYYVDEAIEVVNPAS